MTANALTSSVAPLDPARFERELDGKPVRLFTLRNASGMVVAITNYGAKIEQILVPDRAGRLDDVVLGYDNLEGAIGGSPSMGAFIGRYAGRLGHARFTLGDSEYLLGANNGQHCLHGGFRGSRMRVFDAVQRDESSVEMRYVFADGEEGFPGTLALSLVYRVLDSNELVLDYEATAQDKPGVASFTSHAFFNLNGESSGSALDHELMIAADHYLAMDAELVASGELLPVEKTLFDFRQPTVLKTRVGEAAAGAGAQTLDGYDSAYLIRRESPAGLALCAHVSAPQSGRVMEVWSTEPVMQFYTGLQPQMSLPGGPGKSGQVYFQQQGLCFEPQGYPNAPNCPAFPTALIQPGHSRAGSTVYRFSVLPG
ncbi:aldose 1-epimerase [Polaromonas sp. OV174]|uniref:aldose epimerase family protein n=1 Tax=Polaromonas sp. OV174 TaxID=1855300 RepID=UPI0008F44D9D|nr:aldose epimerase family protein [Polaromonas sp. OV174]SFC10173.1 aldose 1-epimerase [Polaromonas sp. OV174]